MNFITCGWCGHKGAHATEKQITENGVQKCTGCPTCYPKGYPPPKKQ